LEQADLYDILERLPQGLQATLGENGGLISGGEGQRVRLGRALLRPDVRLVILDEPFRGLDRTKRRQLLVNARQQWRNATFLCITHDVDETKHFDRVLVIDAGQLVEDGHPTQLAAQSTSRYRQLLAADHELDQRFWSKTTWRRLWLEGGRLRERFSATENKLSQKEAGVDLSQREGQLYQIKGIGPVYARRLEAAGVRTLAKLSQSTAPQIKAILAADGKRVSVNPQSWIEQASALLEENGK
jgi:ABC-type multidrug transport system ATPase subunit